MIRTVIGILGGLLAVAAIAVELSEEERAAIEERIKPVGEVCLMGDSSCASAVASASSEPRSGEEVYNAACAACHGTGAGGAPVYGDASAWADRIAKGEDALHQSGLQGVAGTGMIAKGGCMNCSDQEIMAAVDYMIAGSQ